MDWGDLIDNITDFVGLWLARLVGVLLLLAAGVLFLLGIGIFFLASDSPDVPLIGRILIVALGLIVAGSVASAGWRILDALRGD